MESEFASGDKVKVTKGEYRDETAVIMTQSNVVQPPHPHQDNPWYTVTIESSGRMENMPKEYLEKLD